MSRRTVVVSSTVRDLSDVRTKVLDACLRVGVFPNMMEHLRASSAGAVDESIRLVDEAHVYLGIFAHRYSFIPTGHRISITEMEYARALERKMPRLIFIADDGYPRGAGADDHDPVRGPKLRELKRRLREDEGNVVNAFRTDDELRGQIIHSLIPYAPRDPSEVHHVADVPEPPAPYIAHPYPLMQVKGLAGRRKELDQLTAWVAEPGSALYEARVLSVVAVGGTGKSALTWHWFNEVAPHHMRPLAGRLWWSFYESDARFENFLVRALAYVTRRSFAEVAKLRTDDQMRQLLDALNREPFLLVLDGVERLLLAYNRLDAARLRDEDLDEQTGHFGFAPAAADRPAADPHRLRRTVDERVGAFLQRLAHVRRSRVLISTRLAPADLQHDGARPRLYTDVLLLKGLEDPDALALWKARDGKVSDAVLSVLNRCDNHPLAVQVLASAVANDRAAAGDIDLWLRKRPTFNPATLPVVQVKTHIMTHALDGLSEPGRHALRVAGAFRMPTTYGTLVSLLVGAGRACPDEVALDEILRDLENRGLLGWDRVTNRYDLHPVARGVVWDGLDPADRRQTCALLEGHFAAIPPVPDAAVRGLDSLTPTLELFNALVGQDRYDDAHRLFFDRLAMPLLRWLDAHRLRVQLLEALFPAGTDTVPALKQAADQSQALNSLSLAYRLIGRPGRAVALGRTNVALQDRDGTGREDLGNGRGKLLCRGLRNLAQALNLTGELREADAVARRAVAADRDSQDPWASYWEALDLGWLAGVWSVTGRTADADRCLRRALRVMEHHDKPLSRARYLLASVRLALWTGDRTAVERRLAEARDLVAHAGDREKPDAGSSDRESLIADRLRAQFLIAAGRADEAEAVLYELLFQARTLHLIHEEVNARTLLADLRCRQNKLAEAEELLNEGWSWVEFGPYRLLHADAKLVLSRVHRAAGRGAEAAAAAVESLKLAWCDGPEHSYHWGVLAAREQLRKLGAAAPPLVDKVGEPLVDVDVDPPDGFFAGTAANGR